MMEGSRLIFPNGVGGLWLGPNSLIELLNAEFSNETKDGSFGGANLNISVGDGGGNSGGELNFGGTFLALRKGSRLAFAGVKGKTGNNAVLLERGSLAGELGKGSSMVLQSSAETKSSITFDAAELTLDNISLQTENEDPSFSARSGNLKVLIDRASLNPTPDLKLELGTTSLTLALACHNPASGCDALKWTKAGGVRVQGTIARFGSALKGGFLRLESGNHLKIERGDVQSGVLKVDTENVHAPISGAFDKLEIDVAAQDITFGPNISLRAGAAKFSSDNILVSEQNSVLSGTARLTGSLQEVKVTGMGFVETAGLNSTFDLHLQKEPDQRLRFVKPSRFDGLTTIQGPHAFNASAKFALRDIEYYDGEGSARWDLNITNMSAEYHIPQQRFSASKLGFEAIVNQNNIAASVKTDGPIAMQDQMVRVQKGKFSLDKDISVSPTFTVKIAPQRLVDVEVREELLNNRICSAGVDQQSTDYTASAKVTASVNSSIAKASVANFKINPTPKIDADPGSCRTNLALICAAVGSVTGGMGAIAAGAICYNEIGDLTKDFENNTNRDIERAIDRLSFGH